MEQYISYHKIIQYLSDYQKSQTGIGLNSFGHGNIVYFSMNESGMTPTYPYMFVTPQSVSYDMNTTNWSLQVIFADRINDDMSNEIDVISDMSIQAKRFMSYIQRGMNQQPNLYNVMDCQMPVTGLPFLERFNDFVGGISLDMNITVFEDINACDYYCEDYLTQYLEVELYDATKFRLILWNDSSFTSSASAECNYIVSGTAYGSSGTTYTGTQTINSGQHQHQFNLSGQFLPGETITSFKVHSVNTGQCVCPIVTVDFTPYK